LQDEVFQIPHETNKHIKKMERDKEGKR